MSMAQMKDLLIAGCSDAVLLLKAPRLSILALLKE
jgi:hypothetical protein